jgi:hypothetical protein
MDWIHLAQDRDQWRARECSNEFSGSIKYSEIFEQLAIFQEGLSFVEIVCVLHSVLYKLAYM